MRINQIRQTIRTENHNDQITECDEFRMTHGERTSIRQVEIKWPKTVGGQLSQFVNVHTIKSSGKHIASSTEFHILIGHSHLVRLAFPAISISISWLSSGI